MKIMNRSNSRKGNIVLLQSQTALDHRLHALMNGYLHQYASELVGVLDVIYLRQKVYVSLNVLV